jgi:Glycosyl transferase family 2
MEERAMNATGVTGRVPLGSEWHGSVPVELQDMAAKAPAPSDITLLAHIAVLIPCRNEAPTIAKVVADFIAALPQAIIYVYDNDSSDGSVIRARAAGAIVQREPMPGKGNVVRRMFADVDADVYVLVDGDDTYDAADAPRLVRELLDNGLDMVNGRRVTQATAAFRRGHRFGNRLLTLLVGKIFGNRISDVLSGYKVFSRRFVKSYPALASGFETETELAVHALELRMPLAELDVAYRERPGGSESKLRTYRDGLSILGTILWLVKEDRPLPFFSFFACALASVSLVLGGSVLIEFMETGLVPRLPTAVLATGLMLLAFLSLACGLILDTVALGRRELKRLHYLAIPQFSRR